MLSMIPLINPLNIKRSQTAASGEDPPAAQLRTNLEYFQMTNVNDGGALHKGRLKKQRSVQSKSGNADSNWQFATPGQHKKKSVSKGSDARELSLRDQSPNAPSAEACVGKA